MATSTVDSVQPVSGMSAAAAVRLLWLAVAAVGFGSVVVAVGLQHLKDLDPCPLCIIQRYLHLAVAAFALGAGLSAGSVRRLLSRACGLLTLLAALGGAAVASHQVWMQQNPLLSRCSRQLFELVNNALPAQLLPSLFRGAGDCLAGDWVLFGLTMPAWSLVLFCAYLIAAWPALALAWWPAKP
jgi:disulfide bond formation protein DsbB